MLNSGLSLTIIIVAAVLVSVTLYYIAGSVYEIFKKKRKFEGKGITGFFVLVMSIALMGGFAYCLYNAPNILFNGLSWPMIEEYGPSALLYAVLALSAVIPVFYLYFMTTYFFAKQDDRPYFMIIVLSAVSGIGNSLIVFIINEALNRTLYSESRNAALESGLYAYFILGIMLFTVSSMIVRKKLIAITSSVVYEKRMEIINRILKSSYYKFESLEDGKVYAALNNDTENISGFVNMFVSGLTAAIVLITCFVYLGTLNFFGMVFSLAIILIAAALFLWISGKAERFFEANRDIQNTFFKHINDLTGGFKELYINRKKRHGFGEDIQKSCEDYRDTRVKGEYKFVGVMIMGEMMYTAVIGIVVFTFPLLFSSIQDTTLRNYVVVYLYMGGIVNQLIYLVPAAIRVLVSWRRINGFIEEVSFIEDAEEEIAAASSREELNISFNKVVFRYKNENGEKFSVGPISYTFKSGEVTFISGGNGSGKSTLAKLLTGLYECDEGEITVNGSRVEPKTLGSYFSTVYSGFHLFDKLYGIDYGQKEEEINKYLEMLRINDKVSITDGIFDTLKLSTGQRKRLALLVSYLEDRPAYLFDEWAADQDPEFRGFFYRTILPELKARGKAVIAITHDDRYFKEADRLIKMENGKIAGEEGVENSGNVQAVIV